MTKRLLPLTNDYVFKRNFGYKGEEEVTKVLLKDITKSNISFVELDNNPITQKDLYDEKLGIMDVKATMDGNVICDIEVQVVKQIDIIKRIMFYWSKMYSREVKSGSGYETAKRTICVLIADFELKETEYIEKYITKWNLREEDYPKKILTDCMEFYIIELPKVTKYQKQNKYKNLNLWVEFIKNPEVNFMVEKDDDELKETIDAIEKAKENLEKISEDEHERELSRLREKYIRDQYSIKATGYSEGLEVGKKDKQIEIAKRMLSKGIDIDTIIEITELTKEEIEKLK